MTTVSPANAAEPIVMPFGILSGGLDLTWSGNPRAKRGRRRIYHDRRCTQCDSAVGSTGTVRMPTGVYYR